MSITFLRSATCCFATLVSVQIANGATIEWRDDTTGITVNSASLVQTVDGITVTATGFVAELGFEADNPGGYSDAAVVGPFPTSSASARKPFGIAIRDLAGEQLGLAANPEPGVPAAGSDTGGGGIAPGFDSGPYRNIGEFNNRFMKFDFAVFEFSAAVDIGSVFLDDVTNNARDAWFAYGTEAPDFSAGFLSGISPFTVLNGAEDASDGLFEHILDVENLTYLLIGAPPIGGLGPLDAGNSQFNIDSFANVALSNTGGQNPTVPAVPLPAGFSLMLTAFLGFGALTRRRKAS